MVFTGGESGPWGEAVGSVEGAGGQAVSMRKVWEGLVRLGGSHGPQRDSEDGVLSPPPVRKGVFFSPQTLSPPCEPTLPSRPSLYQDLLPWVPVLANTEKTGMGSGLWYGGFGGAGGWLVHGSLD